MLYEKEVSTPYGTLCVVGLVCEIFHPSLAYYTQNFMQIGFSRKNQQLSTVAKCRLGAAPQPLLYVVPQPLLYVVPQPFLYVMLQILLYA